MHENLDEREGPPYRAGYKGIGIAEARDPGQYAVGRVGVPIRHQEEVHVLDRSRGVCIPGPGWEQWEKCEGQNQRENDEPTSQKTTRLFIEGNAI